MKRNNNIFSAIFNAQIAEDYIEKSSDILDDPEQFSGKERDYLEDLYESATEQIGELQDILAKIQDNLPAIEDVNEPTKKIVTEYCSHCEKENMGYEFKCQHCGKKLMLCSVCKMLCESGLCNWDKKTESCCMTTEE